MPAGNYWAVASTVPGMEPAVRFEIEKTNRGAFLPTFIRRWTVDGKLYEKEYPLLGGYVFFLTEADDWAGIPDIRGVFDVLSNPDRSPRRVSDAEMGRLFFQHATGANDRTDPARFTKYYRPERAANGQFGRKPGRRRRPRPGKMLRNAMRSSPVT